MAGPKAVRNPEPEDVPEVAGGEESEFEPYVEWVGSVGHREVTAQQWIEAGIEDQGTVIWTRDNPRVDMSALTPAASERLAGEPNFKFVTQAPKEND